MNNVKKMLATAAVVLAVGGVQLLGTDAAHAGKPAPTATPTETATTDPATTEDPANKPVTTKTGGGRW